MKREDISNAVGNINKRHIQEAICNSPNVKKVFHFKKPFSRIMTAAVLALCLLVGGISIFSPFGGMTVAAFAYGTDEEITKAGTVINTGTISNSGEMVGHPMMFYLTGNDIATVRFSCKEQQIDFVDWTQKRDEYGVVQNFTVPYGEDTSEYYYLTVTWEPNRTIRALTDGADINITELPPELRKDVIVMEITFANGKKATKAITISLLDDGKFFATFDDYKITEQDKFVQRPDSVAIPRDILYAQGSDAALTQNDSSYQGALSSEELDATKLVATNYYKNTIWSIEKIVPTAEDNLLYKNEGIEAKYAVGNIIIFDVTATRNGETEKRTISVAKTESGDWEVINEGF